MSLITSFAGRKKLEAAKERVKDRVESIKKQTSQGETSTFKCFRSFGWDPWQLLQWSAIPVSMIVVCYASMMSSMSVLWWMWLSHANCCITPLMMCLVWVVLVPCTEQKSPINEPEWYVYRWWSHSCWKQMDSALGRFETVKVVSTRWEVTVSCRASLSLRSRACSSDRKSS